MSQGRVLAVDAGEKRVGLAVSDELRVLASPLGTLRRTGKLSDLVAQVAATARREAVERVVVGLPLHADGTEGRQAKRARTFARALERLLGRPVELWDERLSTREAEAAARAQGRSMRRLRAAGVIDAMAAAIILQEYLDAGRRNRAPAPGRESNA